MQYAYEKLMAEKNLTFSELPADAKTAITSLGEIVKGINLTKQRGQEPKSTSYDKVKLLDKAAVSEIVDYIEEKEEEEAKAQADLDAQKAAEDEEKKKQAEQDAKKAAEEEAKKKQAEEKKQEAEEETAYGDSIEAELKALSKSGKEEFSPEEIKESAPLSYKEIFNSYEVDGENGVKAGKFLLKETSPGSKIFKF
jgi:membrane protein involved in colicin uptake